MIHSTKIVKPNQFSMWYSAVFHKILFCKITRYFMYLLVPSVSVIGEVSSSKCLFQWWECFDVPHIHMWMRELQIWYGTILLCQLSVRRKWTGTKCNRVSSSRGDWRKITNFAGFYPPFFIENWYSGTKESWIARKHPVTFSWFLITTSDTNIWIYFLNSSNDQSLSNLHAILFVIS